MLALSLFLIALFSASITAFGQVTGRLEGDITDPAGATIPGAQIELLNPETGQRLSTKSADNGHWTITSLNPATYTVTVMASGFKTGSFPGVVIQAGIPATLNVKLEIGSAQQTVEVSGAAETLQSATATVSTTLTGRQINELPYSSRNAMDIVTAQPGTQSPGTPRTSSINGLPKGTLNLTIDGVNIQDNYLKSSDGYFANIQPKPDTVEEVTVSTAGAGAESTGQGAAQVKFVTKSGTNEFHGGLHWQHRNTALNSNYYFNNELNQQRDHLILNQASGHIGGPIWKNKAFFFFAWEEFRLPQTYGSPTQTILSNSARNGIFQYVNSTTRQVQSVNLYNLAAGRGYVGTPDPTVAYQLGLISQLTSAAGTIVGQGTSDLNRNTYTFQTPGNSIRHFPTVRLDANLTSKLHWEFIGNYQQYYANPDAVNTILPIYPGTGTVLGNPVSGGTRRISFSGVTAVRYTISNSMTSETRFGLTGGDTIFRDEITPALFSQFGGYATSYNSFVTNPYNTATSSRRNSPVKNLEETLSWVKGNHLFTFGGSFTQINLWQVSTGTQVIPVATFGIQTNDPINTGATSIFTAANFPGSSATDLTNAGNLYALLTGRVYSTTGSRSLDEKTRTYLPTSAVDRDQQREMSTYVADTWRVSPNLTLSLGVRWEVQFPFHNLSGIYTHPTYAGLFGVSGVGNVFAPGVLAGSPTQYYPVTSDTPAYNTDFKKFLPSAGFAYKLPGSNDGWRSWLAGKPGASVFRAGYSISSVREGTAVFTGIWGANQGVTVPTGTDPGNYPTVFGAPGSVLYRNGNLPFRSFTNTPTYPIPAAAGSSINDFDPNLHLAYVQSWNVSLQREIAKNTVLDVRYVANHSVGLWRQYNLNEINIYENGFLNEFNIAQNNLAIARRTSPTSVNFGNQGLAGQQAVPILQTALGTTSDTTTANYLLQGQAGIAANSIATNATRMARLTSAGRPANFFQVNPTLGSSGAYVVANSGGSTYNSLQVEVRRRMTAGLEMQGSYVFAKALSNMDSSSSGVLSQPTTIRNTGYDKGPSPWDIRHAFKSTAIYELPIGPGKSFLGNVSNGFARKALEGWQLAGVMRIQAGSPMLLRSGRYTVNYNANTQTTADAGVILHGITTQQLQSQVGVYKNGDGTVNFLPQSLLDNSYAAFEVNGKALTDLNANAPYIGPANVAGQLGSRIFLYGPWGQRYDLSIIKNTRIREKQSIEFRAQFLNAFNNTVFYLASPGNDVNTGLLTGTGPVFGKTQSAYRDITVSGTNDPGGRLIEFALRYNF